MTSVHGATSMMTDNRNRPPGSYAGGGEFDQWFGEVLNYYSEQQAGDKSSYVPDGLLESEENNLSYYSDDKDDIASVDLGEELAKWLHMSLGEALRAQYLADHDLTEEELEALPENEREKIEADIKDYIREEVKRMTGAEPTDRPDDLQTLLNDV